MVEIENTLVSDSIFETQFCCNLAQCRGTCCIEGDAGAPITEEEIAEIEANLDKIIPFLSERGLRTIEKKGVFETDKWGNWVTPLVDGCECAFAVFSQGIAQCAIEKAYDQQIITFQKPVSCHLYPIRIVEYESFSAVNYHQWHICKYACEFGKKNNVPLLLFLEKPLIRKFGKKWFDEACEILHSFKNLDSKNL